MPQFQYTQNRISCILVKLLIYIKIFCLVVYVLAYWARWCCLFIQYYIDWWNYVILSQQGCYDWCERLAKEQRDTLINKSIGFMQQYGVCIKLIWKWKLMTRNVSSSIMLCINCDDLLIMLHLFFMLKWYTPQGNWLLLISFTGTEFSFVRQMSHLCKGVSKENSCWDFSSCQTGNLLFFTFWD